MSVEEYQAEAQENQRLRQRLAELERELAVVKMNRDCWKSRAPPVAKARAEERERLHQEISFLSATRANDDPLRSEDYERGRADALTECLKKIRPFGRTLGDE